MKKKLIGIAGKARTGKDTIARHLWAKHSFTRIAFADPVKLAAQAMFGLTHDQTWDDNMKEKLIPEWGMSPREIFQRVGTECVRDVFGADHWLNRWAQTYRMIKDTDDIVVPDVRFENEAAMIRDLGGLVIHLVRDGAHPVARHVSESGVAIADPDIVINNNGTIEDLQSLVDTIVEGLEMRA